MPALPLRPRNPERICWGCSRYCPVDDMACGNGTIRAPHPCELFGDDWYLWALDPPATKPAEAPEPPASPPARER